MQDYSIERVGSPDLVFTGDIIGQSLGTPPRLRIYRTKGGEFVGQLSVDSERSYASAFPKPADLVAWVKNNEGSISETLQTAVEQAAKNDPAFKSFWTDRIE